MSRSALLDLLPDLSDGRPNRAQPRAPGFEPLVHEAGGRDGFTSLRMPSGFSGLADSPGSDLSADPFGGDIPDLGSDGDLSAADLAMPDEPPADLSGISLEDPAFPGGLGTEEPFDLDLDTLSEAPAETPFDAEPGLSLDGPDAFADDGEQEDAAGGIAAHELLEAAHRAEINDIETAHRAEMEKLVSETIPRLREEISDAIAAELAPLLTTCLRGEALKRTLESMVGEVTSMLKDTSAVGFELRGPESLLSAFMEKWGGDADTVKLVPGDGVDLVARIDRSVVATRLSDLDRLFQEALS